jgi:hypothetical protein
LESLPLQPYMVRMQLSSAWRLRGLAPAPPLSALACWRRGRQVASK